MAFIVETNFGQGEIFGRKLQGFPFYSYKKGANVISICPTQVPQLSWKLIFHEKERQL